MPKLLLAVTGSIAAYKSLGLLRPLKNAGFDVVVIQSPTSEQFVGPASFAALSGNPVLRSGSDFAFPHLDLARESDILVVCPATATTMARLAHGIADEIVSATALGFDGPKIMAPAMNVRMWNAKPTQRNLALLQEDGWQVVMPDSGDLACGDVGIGRLAKKEDILKAIFQQSLGS